MRFIEIKIINCIDPQNCLINYLDPVLLEQIRPGDAKHKINLPWPYIVITKPKKFFKNIGDIFQSMNLRNFLA